MSDIAKIIFNIDAYLCLYYVDTRSGLSTRSWGESVQAKKDRKKENNFKGTVS
jgi:hypothetical protein